jgi:hypothetical protein
VRTTNSFDAGIVDPDTVLFASATPVRWTLEDVDGGGDLDLLFHFKMQELSLTNDSTTATLTGTTYGGQATGHGHGEHRAQRRVTVQVRRCPPRQRRTLICTHRVDTPPHSGCRGKASGERTYPAHPVILSPCGAQNFVCGSEILPFGFPFDFALRPFDGAQDRLCSGQARFALSLRSVVYHRNR